MSTPAGRYVLRLSQGPDAWLTADRSVERALHGSPPERASLRGSCTQLTAGLITEYVSGGCGEKRILRNPEHLERLAARVAAPA